MGEEESQGSIIDMNPGSEVVTFDIILWRAQMILHLQKLVSRDSTDRVEAVHTAKMVLRGFAMLISLYKLIFWELHNKGEKHKNRFGNLVPTLAMEVRDHCLVGFERCRGAGNPCSHQYIWES